MSTLYNPSSFHVSDQDALCDMVQAHPLATLVSCGPNGMKVSHLPMHMTPATADSPMVLSGHVARANDHWKEIENGGAEVETLAIFHGPQAYITPQWYPSKLVHAKVVPTWDYAAFM